MSVLINWWTHRLQTLIGTMGQRRASLLSANIAGDATYTHKKISCLSRTHHVSMVSVVSMQSTTLDSASSSTFAVDRKDIPTTWIGKTATCSRTEGSGTQWWMTKLKKSYGIQRVLFQPPFLDAELAWIGASNISASERAIYTVTVGCPGPTYDPDCGNEYWAACATGEQNSPEAAAGPLPGLPPIAFLYHKSLLVDGPNLANCAQPSSPRGCSNNRMTSLLRTASNVTPLKSLSSPAVQPQLRFSAFSSGCFRTPPHRFRVFERGNASSRLPHVWLSRST